MPLFELQERETATDQRVVGRATAEREPNGTDTPAGATNQHNQLTGRVVGWRKSREDGRTASSTAPVG